MSTKTIQDIIANNSCQQNHPTGDGSDYTGSSLYVFGTRIIGAKAVEKKINTKITLFITIV